MGLYWEQATPDGSLGLLAQDCSLSPIRCFNRLRLPTPPPTPPLFQSTLSHFPTPYRLNQR